MRRLTGFLILAPVLCSGEIDFNRDIRPILSDRCFHCHGPDAENQRSDYQVDTEDASRASLGDGLWGIFPGDLKTSELHWRIRSDDESEQMPPPDSNRVLSDHERDLLDQWITEGAEYDEHWSFKPVPASIEVPASGEGWARGEIDRFVAAGREGSGIEPSAKLTPEKWLRRVTFDVTGLPPTLEEIDLFLSEVAKAEEAAYAAAADRLFRTPAHAERLATEWLDVARYSDSYGFQVDRDRDVSPWRDWVLQAFQENLPYSDFMTWQLAGDLLPDATSDQILATAFNRLHPQKVEGGSVPEEFRTEYVADRLHTFGTAFLGLTMECCRCHDHKYDPISTKEYYQLGSYFANVDEAGLYSFFTSSVPTPAVDLPSGDQAKNLAAAKSAVAEAEATLAAALKDPAAAKAFAAWERQLDPAEQGLIAHLDFEGADGKTVPDLANAENAATSHPDNKVVEGRHGKGLHLTGDRAVKLKVGNFTRDQPFSVALWLQAAKHSERQLVFRRSKAWTDAASRGYELLLEDGHLSAALVHFEPGNAIRIRSTEPIAAGQWKHVTLTYNGSSRAGGLQLYLDGKPLPTEVVRDRLTREITGGGDDFLAIGERMRDRGFKNGLIDEFRVYDRKITPLEVGELHARGSSAKADDGAWLGYFAEAVHPAVKEARNSLLTTRQARSKAQSGIREIMVMREMPEPRPAFILNRGAYDQRGEPVTADVPAVLPPLPDEAPTNRLGLAQWLLADDQPLTARVTVNRYWQMLFGQGLVRTPEDFGAQGALPTHPELLDWLARDFMNHDWDLRRLLRQMVLSSTYRQSTVVTRQVRDLDPENELLARMSTRRLPAEMIRDNALAVSGLLDRKVGGGSVNPYDLEAAFKPAKPNDVYRRSLYTYWRRTAPSPLMIAFDASKRDVCRVSREPTASPIQALVLLNGPQFVEASRVLAVEVVKRHPDDEAALIEEVFRLATSRAPVEKEVAILQQLLKEQREQFGASPEGAAEFLEVGNAPAPPAAETDAVEVAAVAVLINTLLNFDECVSRR